jgi:thiamine pyrophosphate-dependent acetolactate synthase large subunit-like protein
MVQIRGKHVPAELLHQEGVEYIFGNPGTTELPLMDVLAPNHVKVAFPLVGSSLDLVWQTPAL